MTADSRNPVLANVVRKAGELGPILVMPACPPGNRTGPYGPDHRWGPWHGHRTRFRICDTCGLMHINTTRPRPFIDFQPGGHTYRHRSSWAG